MNIEGRGKHVEGLKQQNLPIQDIVYRLTLGYYHPGYYKYHPGKSSSYSIHDLLHTTAYVCGIARSLEVSHEVAEMSFDEVSDLTAEVRLHFFIVQRRLYRLLVP